MARNQHLFNGSGVAVGDVNGDGWPDLYLAHLGGPNALYLNRGTAGSGIQFSRVPDAGGAQLPGEYSTGAALADVTGNGRLDLLVTTLGGPNVLYENRGEEGLFHRVEESGLHSGRGSTTMALADLNGDRALDLYVANYKVRTLQDSLPPSELGMENIVQNVGPNKYKVKPKFEGEYTVRAIDDQIFYFEQGEPDRVYFNDGEGRFEEQSWTDVFRTSSGERLSEAPKGWGLVARLEDLTGDGTPDLFVCNDFRSPDWFYRGSDGAGRFREMPEETIRTTSHSTMSIATTDLERDGDVDFFLADMLGVGYERRQQQVGNRAHVPRRIGQVRGRRQQTRNTLQMNRGDATFLEVGQPAGVEASGWTWASTFVDVNLDGFGDLLLSNGLPFDMQNADAQTNVNRLKQQATSLAEFRRTLFEYPRLDLKNAAFRNEGDGTFTRMTDGWGLGETPDVGHGMATGDFDRDGDLDVVINRLNQPVGIYRNEASDPRVAVRLAGRAPNTGAVGAKVRVAPQGGAVPAQKKAVIAGGEYVSDSGGTLSFAVGAADSVHIRVRWPEGETTQVRGKAGRLYEVRQPGAEPEWRSAE
jgi:hypothetical protein